MSSLWNEKNAQTSRLIFSESRHLGVTKNAKIEIFSEIQKSYHTFKMPLFLWER